MALEAERGGSLFLLSQADAKPSQADAKPATRVRRRLLQALGLT
jgi:hypothetical protein